MKKIFFFVFVCTIFITGAIENASAQIYINELVADNQNGAQDLFNDTDDWIELYNAGGLVNLAGYYLSDDPANLTKWKFPTDACYSGFATMTPGSHLIIWADKDTIIDPCNMSGQGPDHANFSLSVDGESVILTDPDGVTIIDQVTYPQMVSDISYGRSTDGADSWQYFNNVTFDNDNGEAQQQAVTLFINEAQADNQSTFADSFDEFEPWFEIYNPNNFQVNVAGYYVSNTADELLWLIPNTNPYRTLIEPNGFIILWCDNEPGEDSNHTNFILDNAGGTITLTGPDGTSPVDSYTYPALATDESWGRSSDGNPNSITFNTPTPTVSNTLVIVQAPDLYINEVMAANTTDTVDNYLEYEDWFEIYNPNNFDVDLAGYYFSDNPENPQKWQVPSGNPDSTTVEANSWLLFWADEDGVQGVNHASFRLNNTAEELNFYTPDGFSLIDHIEWTNLGPDTSLGRITDGSETWFLFIGTTPEYSNNEGELEVDESIVAENTFSIWPNPSSEFVMMNERCNVSVLDLSGKMILRSTNTSVIDVQQLSAGIYFLQTDAGKTARLVVR